MKNYEMISKVTLWVLLLLGVVVGATFFIGPNEAEGLIVASDELAIPVFTNLFLSWNYILFALVILTTLVFVVAGFARSYKQDAKKALMMLGVLVAFVLLFVVCWFLGSPEKIHIVGYDGTDNEGFWAQLSDMMMYVTYVLLFGTIATLVWGVVYTKLKK